LGKSFFEIFKIKKADTTSRETTKYDLEITVLKADEKSYTVEWIYKNITNDSENPTIKKLMNITKDLNVIYKTDELGSFVEVVNWKEIKEYTQKALSSLKKDFKDIPEMDKVLKQMEATFSTKEAIEATSIKDIQQFHTFLRIEIQIWGSLRRKIKSP